MPRIPNPQLARDWRARLDRFERSGLTIAQFCQREGCSTASFYQWRRKLRNASPPAFVPVDLRDDASPASKPLLRVELPGGAVMVLPADANVAQQRDWIMAIVQATAVEVTATGEVSA